MRNRPQAGREAERSRTSRGAPARGSASMDAAALHRAFAPVRKAATALSGVEEGLAYGTPALRARGKFVARLLEDGRS